MNTSSQGYQRQYLTKSFTYQHFFCILIWYLILALPFYFSFGDQKFWQKPKNQMLNLQYNFTGYYAVQANFVENNQFSSLEYSNIVGSTLNSLNSLASFTVNDQNQLSTIEFTLTNFAQKVVQDINVILYYKLWISQLGKEISTAWVQNIKGDLSYAQMSGIVRYQPETQINNIDNRLVLNYPAYLPNLKPPTSFDSLMDHIIENSQVHRLNHELTKSTAISLSSAQRKFKISLIKDTKVNVPYYPSVLETLKFAFLKWLAFVIIAYFVFYKLMEKLVKDGALVTKVKEELVPLSGTH